MWINPARALPAFRALRHRNYRLFFIGQVISFVGTWMQNTAQGWLVYELTHSSAWLGLIGFLSFLPYSFFAFWGGSVADRLDKRLLILTTQTLALLLALLFAALVWASWITVHAIALLAFGLGMVNAFDTPARQAFVIDLVGKEDLQNGIALNSAMFNAARLLGPALAGVVIARFGIVWCLFANAVSFLPALVTLGMIRMTPHTAPRRVASGNQTQREVWLLLRHSPALSGLLLLVGITTIFGWSFMVVLPVFAEEILGGGAVQLGSLLSASGLGALISAIALAMLGNRIRPRHLLLTGLAVFVFAIATFAISREPWLSRLALTFSGFGLIMFYVNCNTALQHRSPDHLRGRLMGLYTMCFGGLMPIGSLQVGLMSQRIGAPAALLLNAGMCGLAGFVAFRALARQAVVANPEITPVLPTPGEPIG